MRETTLTARRAKAFRAVVEAREVKAARCLIDDRRGWLCGLCAVVIHDPGMATGRVPGDGGRAR